MRGAHIGFGNGGYQGVLEAHGKQEPEGQQVGVAVDGRHAPAADQHQDDTFQHHGCSIHVAFRSSGYGFYHKVGYKGTHKKKQDVEEINKALPELEPDHFFHKIRKVTGNIGGEFLNG